MGKTALILPAYNEEENIQIVIKEARKFMPNSPIIVVDDGSKDRTFELAKKSGATVLRHKKNRGKGEAIKTGFNFLKEKDVDHIIVADTDRQYRIKDAQKFLEALKDGRADFVMGKRDWSKVPLRHRFGNFVWKASFNLLFGQRMEDTNCGFVAFSKEAMEKMKDSIHGGYILEDEMLIAAVKNNFKIAQVPVDVVYRRKSGILRGIRMVLGVLIFILLEGIKFRFGRKAK